MDILSALDLKAPDTYVRTATAPIQTVGNAVSFYNGVANYTGAIVILLPACPTATMVGLRIEGFEYKLGTGAWAVVTGGYLYPTGNVWLEYAAQALSPQVPIGFNVAGVPTIRLGALVADPTQRVVILGDITSVWQYPGLRVSEAQFSYSGWNRAWEVGWTATGAVIDLSPYTNIVSIPLQGVLSSTVPTAIGAGAIGTGTTLARADHTHTGTPTTRSVIAGAGLTGGGDLSADRTFNVVGDATLTVAADQVSVASSPKWTTGRTIALTGDVTGTSVAFDGTAALSFATAIGAGVIVDADINGSAAIAQSKIANLSTDLTARVLKAGDTMTGALVLPAATTAIPSMRLPHGAAPTAPTNGDLWTTTAGVYARINGATVGPLSAGAGSTEVYVQSAQPAPTVDAFWVDSANAVGPQTLGNYLPTSGGNVTGNVGIIGTLSASGDTTLAHAVIASGADMQGSGVQNLSAPTGPNDATTKAYVDALAYSVPTGFRNVIRNGDMSVAQRGNGPHTMDDRYAIDGYYQAGFGGTRTLTRVIPALGLGAAQLEIVTSGQAATNDFAFLQAVIEGVQTLHGQTVTLSFSARALSGTPKIGLEYYQGFGSGGTPSIAVRAIISSLVLSTTMTRYSVTFTVPSVVGKTLGTNGKDVLAIIFWFSAGTTYAANSNIGIQNSTIYITDVQLEAGSVATPFERLPIQQQLAWCQRYFYRSATTSQWNRVSESGQVATSILCYPQIKYPVPMRSIPAFSYSTPVSNFAVNPPNAAVTGLSIDQITSERCSINTAVASGLVTGNSCILLQYTATSVYLDFSAEL